jgi:hypothetical protein
MRRTASRGIDWGSEFGDFAGGAERTGVRRRCSEETMAEKSGVKNKSMGWIAEALFLFFTPDFSALRISGGNATASTRRLPRAEREGYKLNLYLANIAKCATGGRLSG